jgi:hypothetical protein
MRFLFCSELESEEHISFRCDIVKTIRGVVCIIMKKKVSNNYEKVLDYGLVMKLMRQ